MVILGKIDLETASKIEADLNGWLLHMQTIGDRIPDFWDELNISERLGEWLSACGYRKLDTTTAS